MSEPIPVTFGRPDVTGGETLGVTDRGDVGVVVTDGPARLVRETDWARVAATDADSVELKVLVAPGSDAVSAVAEHVRQTRRRRLYLVDTAGGRLTRSGLALRLRRLGSCRADFVVRAREHAYRGARRPGARVELDVLPGETLRTEQVGRALEPEVAAAFCGGALPFDALLSDEQRRFLHQVGPDWLADVPFTELRPHGPLVVERLRLRDDDWGGGRAFLERCTYSDGSGLEELSVRCEPSAALRTAVRIGRFLDRCRLRVAECHVSKTDAWLERLSARTPSP